MNFQVGDKVKVRNIYPHYPGTVVGISTESQEVGVSWNDEKHVIWYWKEELFKEIPPDQIFKELISK